MEELHIQILTGANGFTIKIENNDFLISYSHVSPNFIVDVGDYEQLALALERVLTDQKLTAQLVASAKKEVEQYHIRNIVKQYEQVIDSVFQQ